MKQASGGRSRGYTILETMIFLAVSAGMFISAAALLNGRQARTEFTSAVRDFEANFRDIATDVSSGYYANAATSGNRVQCTADPSGIRVTAPNNNDRQGKNSGCIFIGKSLQFKESGSDNETYNVISLAGSQFINALPSNGDVTNLVEAKIKPLAPGVSNSIDTTSKARVGGGVTAECVLIAVNSVTPDVSPCRNTGSMYKTDVINFISTFQPQAMSGGSDSGSSQVNVVVAASATNGDRSLAAAAGAIAGYTEANTVTNPAGGVYVCLQSNGSDQYGLVKLGGQSSRFSVATTIFQGKCS